MRKPRIFTWWSVRPEVLQRAVGAPARQVAGAVHPRAGRRRTGRRRTAPRSARAGRGSRGPARRPPRYSSPGTPTGTGRSRVVQHVDARVRDRPADRHARPSSASAASSAVTSTAASVGPYRLCSSAPRQRARRTAAAARGGSASPLQTTRRSAAAAPRPPAASRNACSIDGTKCSVGDRLLARSAAPGTPGRGARRARAITSRAPVSSGQKNSHTDTSKLNGVFCSTAVVAGRARTRACIHASRFTIAAVRDRHALRPAGRARGVDHVRRVSGVQRRGAGAGSRRRADASSRRRAQHRARPRRQPPPARRDQQHRRPRVRRACSASRSAG